MMPDVDGREDGCAHRAGIRFIAACKFECGAVVRRCAHHRQAGGEIDAVIELPDGNWTAFEIKLGANQIDDAAQNLLDIQQSIAKDPEGKPPSNLCVICGMSNAAYRRPDNVFVIPITALKA